MDLEGYKKKTRQFNNEYFLEDETTNFTSQFSDKSKLTFSSGKVILFIIILV